MTSNKTDKKKKGFKGGNVKGTPLKWRTKEARQKACEDLCEHIASGLSMFAWPKASETAITWYMKNFPEDFSPEKIEEAKRKSICFWETVGRDGTIGKIKGFNPKSWEFNMRNRIGWGDKTKIVIEGGDSGKPVKIEHEGLRSLVERVASEVEED